MKKPIPVHRHIAGTSTYENLLLKAKQKKMSIIKKLIMEAPESRKKSIILKTTVANVYSDHAVEAAVSITNEWQDYIAVVDDDAHPKHAVINKDELLKDLANAIPFDPKDWHNLIDLFDKYEIKIEPKKEDDEQG